MFTASFHRLANNLYSQNSTVVICQQKSFLYDEDGQRISTVAKEKMHIENFL